MTWTGSMYAAGSSLPAKAVMLGGIAAGVTGAAYLGGFEGLQLVSIGIFTVTVFATLFFWKFRLAIAFLGIVTLLATQVLDITSFVESCELPTIMFLVGMMVTVGALKELGFFSWIIQSVISMKGMTGGLFTVTLVVLSALMACAVDEVTSIVFMSALIFQVCDTLKLRPTPFLIIAVLATNIGSSGTMLGNPVGILIGHKSGLTFPDFITWAFPVMLLSLVSALALVAAWYRKDIALLSEKLKERREQGLGLGPMVRIPYGKGLAILLVLLALIASHTRLEGALGLATNTMLIVAPMAVAGVLMLWRHERARHYVEGEVEWWTLLFFMMVFAKAGTLEHTGVTVKVATDFARTFGDSPSALVPVVLATSAVGSAFVDNVVFVAAFIPVVKEFNSMPLWWALLFGACFGGNITMIGSTANIVALGQLEKRYRKHIGFFEWLKVGLLAGVVTCAVAWLGISLLTPFMPEMKAPAAHMGAVERGGAAVEDGAEGGR